MSLDAGGLADDLEAIGPQPTIASAAAAWASAVGAYAAGIVPSSATVAAAAAALQTALATAFAAPNAAPGMETAFGAFGVTLGGGMAGFTPTPPAGPVGFALLFTSPTGDASAAAQDVADAIHTWLTTGTATLIAPPNTVTPWS
jgi:hypothetical protein